MRVMFILVDLGTSSLGYVLYRTLNNILDSLLTYVMFVDVEQSGK